MHIIKAKEQFDLGEFRILPFDTQHDAAEPLGFVIEQKSTHERLLFATDTYYIKYKIPGLNYLMIECNYSYKIIDGNVNDGKLHKGLRDRIIQSHMSLSAVEVFMEENDLSRVKKIILLHLSDSNSDAELFRKTVQNQTNIDTVVAAPGMNVELQLRPF